MENRAMIEREIVLFVNMYIVVYCLAETVYNNVSRCVLQVSVHLSGNSGLQAFN